MAVWAALLGLVFLLRLPYLELPFENDSGAIAYHARLITQGEPLYSTHHPSHHMPGAFYSYALAFKLLGDRVGAVKLVLALWLGVTVCLMYELGRLLANKGVGMIAAVLAAVLYAHWYLAAYSARIELFLGLFQVTAVLILVYTLQRQGPARNFFLIGLVGALACLFKVTALSGFGLAVIACVIGWWQSRNREGFKTGLIRGGWLAAGFLCGLLPPLLYFASLGLFPRFLMIFTLATRYVGLVRTGLEGPQYLLLYPLAILSRNNFLILIASLCGLVFVVRARPKSAQLVSYMALWFFLSLVETSTSRTYLPHYYLVLIPSLTMLAAWFLVKLYQDIAQGLSRKSAVLVLSLWMLAILLVSFRQNSSLYLQYGRYVAGLQSFETFLSEGPPDKPGLAAFYVQDLADYLNDHTDANDTIYYWSNFMELYYLANRRCALAFIWPIYAEASGEYLQIFQAKYVIVGNDTVFGLSQTPEWLPRELARSYTLETTIHGQAVYRRIE